MTPDAASLGQLLLNVDPRLRLVRAWNLTGGVSAQVTAVVATTCDGQERSLVVRQYGAADLRSNPHIACTEYRLLSLLHAAGLPVPRPYHADESCAVLPVPCLILEFIDGEPPAGPADLRDFTSQLAAALADLHRAGFARSDAAFLPDIGSVSSQLLGTRPAELDVTISEAAVRAVLTGNWPPPQVNEPAILHGDYWPGNTLWRHGNLVGVIDWEDAAVGDPLADLGNARLEILMRHGDAAMDEFTRQYCALLPDIDLAALPYWDLYAALRPAGQMDRWGLPVGELERFRAAHRRLVADAMVRLRYAPPSEPYPAERTIQVTEPALDPAGSGGSDARPPLLPGWRVIDMSQAISGPYAARILSDLGADVVRVEGPRTDITEYFGLAAGQRSGMYSQMNAGKRSVGIDLAVPGGTELVRDLAGHADVLIENFRPGVMERLGLGYEQLAAANPALVMLSITGFGPDGPDAQRRALAPVIHAESGLLARQAELDDREPADLPLALSDTVTALHAAIAVLAALHQRAATGRGQRIGLSMLAAVAASDDHAHAAIARSGEPYSSRGTIWQAPGGPLLIAAPPKHAWAMLSRRGLIVDPAPPGSDLPAKARLRRQAIQDWMSSFADRASLLTALEAAGVAWAELRDSTEVFAGGAHSVSVPGSDRRVAALPYEFSDASAVPRRAVAQRGQHNAEALSDWLGLDEAAVASLADRGVLIAG